MYTKTSREFFGGSIINGILNVHENIENCLVELRTDDITTLLRSNLHAALTIRSRGGSPILKPGNLLFDGFTIERG
jgi:hypothetical protein